MNSDKIITFVIIRRIVCLFLSIKLYSASPPYLFSIFFSTFKIFTASQLTGNFSRDEFAADSLLQRGGLSQY